MTSNMFPLFEFNQELLERDEVLLKKLEKLGKLFIDNNIRVTCHPGQFTIINSNEERVILNAIKELEYHAWLFDKMGLKRSPYYAINIHGGKRDNLSKLIDSINNRLPYNVRSRLTLENDERCFSVKQLKEVYLETGIPIVFDSHHFVFNQDGMSMEEAFWTSYDTWLANDEKPLQHISNTEPGNENGSFTERRKHSWGIHYVPDVQLAALKDDLIDLDVEAKGKNISLLQMRKDFGVQ
jgi:UV DNA damage endonuclease